MLPANGNRNSSLLILFLLINFLYSAQLKVATYNILNFPQNYGLEKIDDFRKIIDYLNPDILVVQEMQSQYGIDLFLDSVLNYHSPKFSAGPFHDGPDTDNAIFFRKDKIEFIDALYIPTCNRDIARYHLKIKESQYEFFIFSVHFKAGTGSENESIRLQEAVTLRNHLDSLGGDKEILVVGDFNFYYDELGYKKLLDSVESISGRLFDPLGTGGLWHENRSYSYLHTQSTRNENLPDGGAGGGLDDRFDIILCSKGPLDTNGIFLPVESYTTFGNDGNHFNKSINVGINQAVPDEVADALYFASDHLPVYVHLLEQYITSTQYEQFVVFPNPMQKEAHILFPHYDDFQEAKITITNILGQRLFETKTKNPVGLTITNPHLKIGIYFVHLEIETKYQRRYHRTKLAVVE